MARRLDAGDDQDRVGQARPLRAQPRHGLRTLRARQVVRRGQPDRPRDVLRARPAVPLLGASLLLGEDMRPVTDVQRADPLGSLELVGAERHEVGAQRLDVEVDVRRRLDGIDVEQEALARPHARGDLGDRLDRADLVVGEHDRDQDRLVVEGRLELVRVDPAVAIHRQLDDLEAELLEVAERVAHGVMLDRRGHDPVAAALAGPGRPLDREVVRLGAAGREDDLAGFAVESGRDALVGIVEGRSRDAPVGVGRARVAERFGQERQHRVKDVSPQRRRGRMIEVDRHGPDRTPVPCESIGG